MATSGETTGRLSWGEVGEDHGTEQARAEAGGLLHEGGSKDVVVICDGFRSNKEMIPQRISRLHWLRKESAHSVSTFSGNGESEGSFDYANYYGEVDDLHSVVEYFRGENRGTRAVIGHSKGEMFRITEESLMERLNINMHEACLQINKSCRVLTVHGTADEINPVGDALKFAKILPNHELEIIKGADHCYTSHQAGLASFVSGFIKSVFQVKE